MNSKFEFVSEENLELHYTYDVTDELGETEIGLPLTKGVIRDRETGSVIGEFEDIPNSCGGFETQKTWF